MSISRYIHQGNEAQPIPRLIYFTAQDFKNLAEKILKPYELTIEQFHPLKILSFEPGLTQRQIGDECNKSAANLTRILDRLQKKNLIDRRENPEDRRASLVFLTKHGESLVKEVSVILDSFAAKSLADISAKDQHVLRQALEKMNANLQHIDLNTL
ncbi:MAG: MarR family transcriptional regulator [Proteobacteria bacterium]|nr:MarR family transcriptional regulator [Pseudomonadota bacterium]MBU1640380.1 MarR family transcriptional regulator [Pseudomonadota bacterium]